MAKVTRSESARLKRLQQRSAENEESLKVTLWFLETISKQPLGTFVGSLISTATGDGQSSRIIGAGVTLAGYTTPTLGKSTKRSRKGRG